MAPDITLKRQEQQFTRLLAIEAGHPCRNLFQVAAPDRIAQVGTRGSL